MEQSFLRKVYTEQVYRAAFFISFALFYLGFDVPSSLREEAFTRAFVFQRDQHVDFIRAKTKVHDNEGRRIVSDSGLILTTI